MGGSNNSTQYANQQLQMISQYLAPYASALNLPALSAIIQNGGQGGAVLPLNTAVSMAQNQAGTAGLNAEEAAQRQANTQIGASVAAGPASGTYAAFQDQNAQNIAAAGNSTALNQQQLQMSNFQNSTGTLASIIQTLFGGYSGVSQSGVNNSNYNWLTGNGGLLGSLGGLASGAGMAYSRSDRRMKSKIEEVGKIGPLRVYEYDIDGRRERGVMAQEARVLFPEAVHEDKEGFVVNYKRLKELVGRNA